MTGAELEKELERIIRYHQTPDGYVVVRSLRPKLKAMRRLVEANYIPREPTRPSHDCI